MKRFLSLLLFLTAAIHILHGQEPIEVENFGTNPGNLRMFAYNSNLQTSSKKPLVLVLHGCTQNAENAAELTGWNKLAKLNDFVVVYAQQKFINNPNLCFNWFRKDDTEKNKGECESIFEMVQYAQKNYSIDSNHISIVGLSAGGSMCMAMLATHPEIFQNAAVFAGGAYKVAVNSFDGFKAMRGKKDIDQKEMVKFVKDQNPHYNGQYPNLIIYHGLNDNIVNHKNALIIIEQWAGVNNIDTKADKIQESFLGIKDITRKEYNDNQGKPKITLYEISNLGHELLVNPGEKENEGGKTGVMGVDKNYHSTYQTALEFGLIKAKP